MATVWIMSLKSIYDLLVVTYNLNTETNIGIMRVTQIVTTYGTSLRIREEPEIGCLNNTTSVLLVEM